MARLIDADNLLEEMQFRVDVKGVVGEAIKDMAAIARKLIAAAPTVDAVKLPEGKPGDYLEWDCGTGWTTIYFIYSVNIYPGGEMRYCCVGSVRSRSKGQAAVHIVGVIAHDYR